MKSGNANAATTAAVSISFTTLSHPPNTARMQQIVVVVCEAGESGQTANEKTTRNQNKYVCIFP